MQQQRRRARRHATTSPEVYYRRARSHERAYEDRELRPDELVTARAEAALREPPRTTLLDEVDVLRADVMRAFQRDEPDPDEE